MRLVTLLSAVLVLLLSPRLAMSSKTSFDQLIADLEAVRAEHAVPGFAVTLVSAEQGLLTGSGGVANRGKGTSPAMITSNGRCVDFRRYSRSVW